MNQQPEPDLDADEEPAPPPRPWSQRAQDLAVLVWASFLTAAVGTMLFFAFVDPAELMVAITPDPEGSRMTGYGFGFFFFWLLALAAAALAVFLVRTARRNGGNGHGNGNGNGNVNGGTPDGKGRPAGSHGPGQR